MLKVSKAVKLLKVSRSGLPGLLLIGAGLLATAAVISSALDAYDQVEKEKKEEVPDISVVNAEDEFEDAEDEFEDTETIKKATTVSKAMRVHKVSNRTKLLLIGAAGAAYSAYYMKYYGYKYGFHLATRYNHYNADLGRYYCELFSKIHGLIIGDRDNYLTQARSSADGSKEWERFMSKYEVNKKLDDILEEARVHSFDYELENYGVTEDV